MKPRGNLETAGSSVPRGLQVHTFRVGDSEYALFEWTPQEEGFSALLTKTEQDVARRALGGLSNSEIARARGSSPRTVANQMAAIFRKLGLSSRAQLFALATRCAGNTQSQSPSPAASSPVGPTAGSCHQ